MLLRFLGKLWFHFGFTKLSFRGFLSSWKAFKALYKIILGFEITTATKFLKEDSAP